MSTESIEPEHAFRRAIERRARELGFDVFKVAAADRPLDVDHQRYVDFVKAGRHGEMDYLASNAEARRRVDTDAILEGARSVICVARRYKRADDEQDPVPVKRVARYARGQDYHNHVRRKLRKLAAFVKRIGPDGTRARPLCDIEPILERAWAARAGLGFVGKNGMLITPGVGSYTLLGEVVTTLSLPTDESITERCGSCVRCLDACPTQAFTEPFVLEPTKCISYWTIEASALAPPVLRKHFGDRLFGCDICQEVCPFNRAAGASTQAPRPFAPLDQHAEKPLAAWVAASEQGFEQLTRGSPLKRPGRHGMARNARVVAENLLRVAPDHTEATEALAAGGMSAEAEDEAEGSPG